MHIYKEFQVNAEATTSGVTFSNFRVVCNEVIYQHKIIIDLCTFGDGSHSEDIPNDDYDKRHHFDYTEGDNLIAPKTMVKNKIRPLLDSIYGADNVEEDPS